MKNIKTLIVATVVLVAGSAFTILKVDAKTKKVDTEQVYVYVGGIPTPVEEVEGKGNCIPGGEFCHFRLAEDGMTPIPLDSGLRWQPN